MELDLRLFCRTIRSMVMPFFRSNIIYKKSKWWNVVNPNCTFKSNPEKNEWTMCFAVITWLSRFPLEQLGQFGLHCSFQSLSLRPLVLPLLPTLLPHLQLCVSERCWAPVGDSLRWFIPWNTRSQERGSISFNKSPIKNTYVCCCCFLSESVWICALT